MAWSVADIPDLTGRVAVVTGANDGLGLETALRLATAGAHVVMAVRNLVKAEAAQAKIAAAAPGAASEIVALDLSRQQSVQDAAAQIRARHRRIDLLVNNAGVMATAQRTTVDGYEYQFGVDHLGHWTFTAELLPALLRTTGSRVVTVTSMARVTHHRLDPADPAMTARYGPWRSYGRGKLANYHFGLGLQDALAAAGAATISVVAHPGAARTGLTGVSVQESDGGFTQRAMKRLNDITGQSAEQGALPQLRAATDPAVRGGEFYGPLLVSRGPAVRRPVLRSAAVTRSIRTLWTMSEQLTGVGIDIAAARTVGTE